VTGLSAPSHKTGLHQQRTQARLLCSLGIALGLHAGAMLLHPLGHRDGLRHAVSGDAPSLMTRTLAVPAVLSVARSPSLAAENSTRPDSASLAATALEPTHKADGKDEAAAPDKGLPPDLPATATELPWLNEDAVDEQPQPLESGLEIVHPDAPLPGGRAEERIALLIDAGGQVAQMRIEGTADLPEIFISALNRALLGQTLFRPALLQGQAARSTLCLRVVFQEGQQPGWELLAEQPAADGRCTADSAR